MRTLRKEIGSVAEDELIPIVLPEETVDGLDRGGVLHAATDDERYFAQMLDVMRGDDRFEPAPPYERGEDEKTDFEIKFLGQGRTVRAASWRKR